MNLKIFTALFFLLIFNPLFSQDLSLSYLTIPDSLKTKANAVFRYDHTNIEMLSASKIVYQKDVAVTVLNEQGDSYGHIQLNYDDHTSISDIKVRILNSMGIEIKKIKTSDFKDVSATDGFSLYTDDRVKYYHHVPIDYPYTIKFSYEVKSSNTAFIPPWYPIRYYYASTQLSTFNITYPEDITIRLKENNFDNYQIKNESSKNKISFTLINAPAIEYESKSPMFTNFGPYLQLAPNKFQLAGVNGEANNWKEFGKWMYDKLIVGTNDLPASTKIEIKELVKGIEDPRERARLVYDYMQEKTRYISVQIGIGGWKPMLANDVDKLGYGDCKALTNYTHALLREANIPSYYTIIYAKRRRNIDKDLASVQGNHAILMVPFKKDTVWLECTNQKVPFGYLGTFTDDRDVLVIKPEGGEILHTTSYSDSENSQHIKGEFTLDENGNIHAKANIKSFGIQYNDNYFIKDFDTKEKDSHYKDFFDQINNIKISNITLKNDEENTCFIEDIEFTAANYAVLSGERMLVRLNALNATNNIPKRYRKRKLPLEIQYGFTDIDEVIINIPQNYTIEALADNKVHETKFGSYSINIEKINDHQLKYSRELLLKQGIYSVEDYNDYRNFQKKISQLDNSKIVLLKN